MNMAQPAMTASGAARRNSTVIFWALGLLLAAVFLLGGGARGDVQSLMILRPIVVLLLAFGLGSLRLSDVRTNRFLCLMGLAIAALPALQLVPLPPSVWSQLAGRAIVVEIGQAAQLGEVWRPISLVPEATLNAFYAALVPLAVLILGIQLDLDRLARLVPIILVLGAISAVLGLLQIAGEPGGPLYLYKITNPGSSVGLFANHNHQAFLLACMLPMLAVFANGKAGLVRTVALVSAMPILAMILLTGSRAGMIVAAIAILAVVLFLRPGRGGSVRVSRGHLSNRRIAFAAICLAALALVFLTVWLGRGLAWERLSSLDMQQEGRWRIAPTVIAMIVAYFPWGTGMGSFEKAYQVHEPDLLLSPEYMNHVHNDWLELALTGGLPAILLAIAAAIALLLRAKRLLSREFAGLQSLPYRRLGLVIVFLAAVASVADYPLRVPSLAALFALASLWAGCPLPRTRPKIAEDAAVGAG